MSESKPSFTILHGPQLVIGGGKGGGERPNGGSKGAGGGPMRDEGSPPCGGLTADGQPCPYRPTGKCDRCGKLTCLEHTNEFVANNTGERWHRYDGRYCDDCVQIVNREYNDEVGEFNRDNDVAKKKAQACDCLSCLGDTTCKCMDDLCKSI